jgi:predicted Zn-dependent protease with MMP-like domain
MENIEFENLITQAVEALPEKIRQKLNNVEIVMEEGESPNNSLFGLYHGVSQLHRGSSYGISPTLPDKITIWKGTIERFALRPIQQVQGRPESIEGRQAQDGHVATGDDDNQAIASLVRRVVWHEIGHHFGFDEPGIRRLEEKWTKQGKV